MAVTYTYTFLYVYDITVFSYPPHRSRPLPLYSPVLIGHHPLLLRLLPYHHPGGHSNRLPLVLCSEEEGRRRHPPGVPGIGQESAPGQTGNQGSPGNQ